MKLKFFWQLSFVWMICLAGSAQAQKNAGSGGNPTPQSTHDSPIIISDGSVKLQINDVFADLTDVNAGYANWKGQPHTLLASLTHSQCLDDLATDCGCSQRKKYHSLYVYKWSPKEIAAKTPVAPTAYALNDCDTVQVYLESPHPLSGKWIPSKGAAIHVRKQHVPIVQFGCKHGDSDPVNCVTVVTTAPPPKYTVLQQQAWLVARVPSVKFSTPDPKNPNDMETVGKYRLGRAEVRDSKNKVKFKASASNSCTVFSISLTSQPSADLLLAPPCGQTTGTNMDLRKVLKDRMSKMAQ